MNGFPQTSLFLLETPCEGVIVLQGVGEGGGDQNLLLERVSITLYENSREDPLNQTEGPSNPLGKQETKATR